MLEIVLSSVAPVPCNTKEVGSCNKDCTCNYNWKSVSDSARAPTEHSCTMRIKTTHAATPALLPLEPEDANLHLPCGPIVDHPTHSGLKHRSMNRVIGE